MRFGALASRERVGFLRPSVEAIVSLRCLLSPPVLSPGASKIASIAYGFARHLARFGTGRASTSGKKDQSATCQKSNFEIRTSRQFERMHF